MIAFMRSWKIVPGKRKEAVARLRKFAEYATENIEGYKCTLLTNRSGDLNQIVWIVTNNSLADFEAMTEKFFNDEGFKAIAAENPADGLFAGTEANFYDVIVGQD